MILSLVALVALARQDGVQAPVPTKPSTPGKLVSLALKRYFDAQSLAGKIHLTQQARGVTLNFDTEVAIDRPLKFVIRQVKGGASPQQWLEVSDGKFFQYDLPKGVYGPHRTKEPVSQHGAVQTVEIMYGAAASTLGERTMLDVIFARKADLAEFSSHLSNLKFNGTAEIRGTTANLVEGDYCEIPGDEPTGAFQLAITDEGDILRYSVKNRYGVPNQPGETIEVLSTWDVSVKVGAKNADSVYAVKG